MYRGLVQEISWITSAAIVHSISSQKPYYQTKKPTLVIFWPNIFHPTFTPVASNNNPHSTVGTNVLQGHAKKEMRRGVSTACKCTGIIEP
jgi:hypothetical protein